MVSVMFVYDEASSKWRVIVDAKDETEAKQAFNAVIITAAGHEPSMDHGVTKLTGSLLEVFPAVRLDTPHV